MSAAPGERLSAREEILGRVRASLADAPSAPEVPRDYRTDSVEPPLMQGRAAPRAGARRDLLDLFVERVEDYKATVVRCAAAEVEERIAEALDGRLAVVPPGLGWEVVGGVPDEGQTAAELDRIDAVVTGATVGIALTGTIVLDHGPGQGRRALSLVPDVHVCVVREDQVVHGVPDAVSRLDPGRPQTWISGPSATSDIELTRVEGVHGPRTLIVVLTA